MVDLGKLGTFSAQQANSLQLGVHSGLGSMFAAPKCPAGEFSFGKLAAVTPKTYEDILAERKAEVVKKKVLHTELGTNFTAAELIIREFIKANDIKITYQGIKSVLGLWHKAYTTTYTPVVKLKSVDHRYILTIENPGGDGHNFCHNSGYEHDNTTEGIVQYVKAYLARNQDL